MSTDNPYEVLSVDDGHVVGPDGKFERCPRCQLDLETGFIQGMGLNYYPDRVHHGTFFSISTASTSIRPNVPFWRRFFDAFRYFPAYLCRHCGCLIVDGSQTIGYFAARKLAKQRLKQ